MTHPHFGLSTFFITQNGAAKGGIRLGPTVADLLRLRRDDDDNNINNNTHITVAMAFAWAALLRWLTPAVSIVPDIDNNNNKTPKDTVYRGWLQGTSRSSVDSLIGSLSLSSSIQNGDDKQTIEYADGLRYNIHEGWYEFRCACQIEIPGTEEGPKPVSEWLADRTVAVSMQQQQPSPPRSAYIPAIRAYLTAETGGNLGSLTDTLHHHPHKNVDALATAIASLYVRMVAGEDLRDMLQEMKHSQGLFGAGMETDCAVLL